MNHWGTEWLLLRRDRTAWLAYALFAIACAFAIVESVATHRRAADFHAALVKEEGQRLVALEQALRVPPATPIPSWADPANPGATGRGSGATYALLPPSALAVVQSRAAPLTAVAVSTAGGALDRALGDIVQPHVESLGRFDLGLLLLVVLPLFVLVLGFDIVVRDHELGTLSLLVVSESRPRRRYAIRGVVRVLPLVMMAFLSILVALVSVGRLSLDVFAELMLALAVIVLYTAFWLAIALLVQSWSRTASASGIASLAVWAVFIVLVPTVLATIAEVNTPIPSRIERTSATREATRRAMLDAEGLLSQYLEDHPELAAAGADPRGFDARRVAMGQAVAIARTPVEQRFFDAVARRGELTERLATASPMSLVARTLDVLAGTNDARSVRFSRAADAFQTRFSEFFDTKTMRGERLTAATLAERPVFVFEDEPARHEVPLVALALWVSTMCGWAALRLGRAIRIA